MVTDDTLGTETMALTETDAASFEIDGTELFLKAGTALDFETEPSFSLSVTVDHATFVTNVVDRHPLGFEP